MTITEDQAKRLGKNLTDIMYRRGVTQVQMSNELRVPKTTVSSWMNGRRMPRAAAMSAICHYLNCTREDLLRLPGEAPTQPTAPRQAVQEPAEEPADAALGLVLDAIEAAGYGHLRGIVEAAAGADESCYDFVIGILKRNPKKK